MIQPTKGLFRIAVVLLVLAVVPSPAAAQTRPATQPALLVTDSRKVLWRSAILLASRRERPDEVTDAVIANPYQGPYLALRLLGPSVLPRVYQHLLISADRDSAIDVIAMFGPANKPYAAELERVALELLRREPANRSVQHVARLLLIVNQDRPAPEALEQLAAEYSFLASIKQSDRDLGLLGQSLSLWTAFPGTRDRGLRIVRRYMVDRPERYPSTWSLLFAAAVACNNGGTLGAADLAALQRLREDTRADKDSQAIPLQFAMIEWLRARDDDQKFDAALEAAGLPSKQIIDRRYAVYIYADQIVQLDEIPRLIARATDRSRKEAVRLGATRLLSEVGPADAKAQAVLGRLLSDDSESEDIRRVAAGAMYHCVDEDGALLRLMKQRIKVEQSGAVWDKLLDAIEWREHGQPFGAREGALKELLGK